MRAAPTSLDPAEFDLAKPDPLKNVQPDSVAQRGLTMLMFDTLVTTDESGRIQPALATSWQASPGNQRWQFRIRRGVKFHDGTPLSAEVAAASLRVANPSWNVSADADNIVIEYSKSDAELLAELALPRNAIVKRNPGDAPSGTGPFHVADWQPGKKLSLAAEENCWRGRPFLDAIEIEMGKSFRDQMTALELGKADLVEVAPEQVASRFHRKDAVWRVRLRLSYWHWSSRAMRRHRTRNFCAKRWPERGARIDPQCVAAGRGTTGGQHSSELDERLRIRVLHGRRFAERARHAREQVRTVPTWTLGYDGSDPGGTIVGRTHRAQRERCGIVVATFAGASGRSAVAANSAGIA